MKHYGDASKISGAEVEPVDIITFGSPCQDMSVAGKRKGMKHAEQGDEETTRSGLFYEAIRIIEEMRKATNGEYPKYAVWENVPGAFSSNKGRDFHAVLEALCSVCGDPVSIPEPYDTKRTKLVWNKAGEVVGENYSVAWRTLDAQYWGVPQRRKRIYLVADFTGRRAGEILFKPDSLRGDLQTGDEAGQEVTTDAVGGVDGGARDCLILKERAGCDGGGKGALWSDKAFTLATNQDMSVCVLNDQGGSSINVENEEVSPTLRANSHQHEPVIALQANGIDRADTAGCNGCGWRENEGYTLNTVDRHAVCYGIDQQGGKGGANYTEDAMPTMCSDGTPHAVCYDARGNGDGNLSPTTTGGHQNRITDYTAVAVQETLCFNEAQITSPTNGNNPQWNEPCHTLSATDNRAPTVILKKPPRKYIIRRLTPTECARLQGFPDFWSTLAPYNPADAEFWEDVRKTHAEINGKKYKPVKNLKKWYDKLHTDSAEYKMWGNGIALPNAEYVIRGIAEQGAKTLGSLFDGSGGFPLAGAMNGIIPLWASEVEPYPIAVTKSRFEGVMMW